MRQPTIPGSFLWRRFRIQTLAALLLVFLVGSGSCLGSCINLTGSYSARITGTMTMKAFGVTDTIPMDETQTVDLKQKGCSFTFVLPDEEEGDEFISGTVDGLHVKFTSKLVNAPTGFTVSKYDFRGSGKARSRGIDLTFTIKMKGTYRGIDFDASGSGRITMTNPDLIAPVVTSITPNQVVKPGQSATLCSTFAGAKSITFQWTKNGVNIPGATRSCLKISKSLVADSGAYQVKASNLLGSKTSQKTYLTVCNYTLGESVARFPSEGGTHTVSVTSSNLCSWSITNTLSDWITLVGDAFGEGNGSFSYVVAENTNLQPRVGWLKIEGKTHTVIQAGVSAPENIHGRILRLKPEGDEGSTNSSVHLIDLAKESELYMIRPENGGPATDAGAFSYARANTNAGTLVLASTFFEDQGNITISLAFSSKTTGNFTWVKDEETAAGSFSLLPYDMPDLGGGRLTDIILQQPGSRLAVWAMQGTNYQSTLRIRTNKPPVGWRVCGAGDFNSDGATDIVFQQESTRKLAAWLMNGSSFVESRALRDIAPGTGWRAVGVADFNNDGKPDVLLESVNRTFAVWIMDGTVFSHSVSLRNGIAALPGWKFAGTGDFNADDQTDIVLKHTDGRLAVWHFIGTSYIEASALKAGYAESTGWTIGSVADFNLDGKTDLLWQHSNGSTRFWFFNDKAFLHSQPFRKVTGAWQIVGPR